MAAPGDFILIAARLLQTESFRKVRPAVIPQHEKADPDIPKDLTTSQVARRESATKEGLSTHYLELLRQALVKNEITFGRFAEMIDMTPREAEEFSKQSGLAT